MSKHGSAEGLAKRIKELLFPGGDDADSRRSRLASAAGRTGSGAPADRAGFEDRLRVLLSHRSLVSAGKLQVLGLDKVREHFGDEWSKVSDKIHTTVRRAIQQRLTPADMYTQAGDLGYIILFGDLTKEEAQIKCALIAEEIWHRLLGDESAAGEVDVKTVAVAVDGNVLVEKVDLFGVVARLLEKADSDGGGSSAASGGWTQSADASADRPKGQAAPRGLRFLYRPVWDVRRNALLYFQCTPAYKAPSGTLLTGYEVLGISPEVCLSPQLDLLVLRRIDHDLRRLERGGRRLPVVCSVHFETLASPKGRGPYIEACRDLPKPLRRYVIFEVVGFPPTAFPLRIAELIQALKPFSRAINGRLDPGETDFEAYRDVGFHAVGMDVGRAQRPERDLMKTMDTFAFRAQRAGFHTFIHGLRSISLVTEAVCAGFDYVDGDAVHALTRAPHHAYQFRSENLFSRLLAEAD